DHAAHAPTASATPRSPPRSDTATGSATSAATRTPPCDGGTATADAATCPTGRDRPPAPCQPSARPDPTRCSTTWTYRSPRRPRSPPSHPGPPPDPDPAGPPPPRPRS